MATRNKIETNTRLFQSLAEQVTDRAVPDARRYIAMADDDEREWLTDTVVEGEFRFDSVNRLLLVRCGERIGAVLVNAPLPEVLPDGLAKAPMNGGLFAVLASEAKIVYPKSDGLEIFDRVFFPLSEAYAGHEWKQLREFFQPLTVIAVEPGGPFDAADGLWRIALLVGASVAEVRTLAIRESTLKICREIALDQRSEIPAGLLAHALVAVRWEHCFLEFYRCIERLFSLPTVVSLKSDLKIKGAAIAISSALETILGWRKQEDLGLATLFEECGHVCANFHKSFVTLDRTLHADYTAKSVANHVYKLRNSIVHYRPATELPTLKEEAWQILIEFFVDAISLLYAKFRLELVSSGVSTVLAPVV